MTRYWKVAALVVLVVLACINPESPRGSTGRLALRIVLAGGGGTPLDSAYLLITGTKDTTLKVTPGATVTVNNLPGPGTYTISIEGFVGGSATYFGQTTGVSVTAGQTTSTSVTMGPLQATPVALPAYTPNGQFTFVYSKVPFAASYVVQRDSLKTFATSHDSAVSPGTDTSVVISIPPTGPYYVRVIAVDQFGKRGPPSTPLDSITTLSNCCTVAPLGASIITTGGTQAFTVSGKDPKGTVINNVAASWSALNPNVASVASTGVATGAGEGQTTIVAAVTGTSATPNALLTVAMPNATPVNVWSGQASGSTQFIIGIWGTSASNIWVAVDSTGSLMHYDGTAWTRVATTAAQSLLGVWGSSANDVFVVGFAGTILHYNGTAWSAMTSNSTALFYRVWGSGPSDVFAVGTGGTIDHYNGTAWTVMNSGTTTKTIYSVWGTAANNVFAVGDSSMILHYDGTAWTPMTTPAAGSFVGVRGTGPSDVFATLGLSVPAAISHYNGTSWVTVAGPYAGVGFLFDAYFMSPTEGFTSSSAGSMYMYNGTWTARATSSQNVLYDLWSTPTAIPYVVGGGGAILQGVRGAPFRAFGDSTQFTAGSYNWSSQLLLGEAISVTSKIELTTFGLIAAGANDSMQMALYTDSSGVPTHLVAQTAHAVIGGAGVHEFPSTIQTQLQPGTYWVMARYDYAPGTPIYEDGATTNIYKYVTDSFSVAGLPNPYPASPNTITGLAHFNYYLRGYVVP